MYHNFACRACELSPQSLSSFRRAQFSSSTTDEHSPGEKTDVEYSTLHLDLTAAELRTRVLEAALTYVPQHGWSRKAVEMACLEGGFPPGLHTLALPQGGIDLVSYFYASRNQHLADAMIEWRLSQTASASTPDQDPLPRFQSSKDVDAFLYRALRFRLEKILPVLPMWPQALGLLALPSNVPSSVGLLAQLVDEVWAQAGDRSTDMTWYAKRLGLAYVYNLTEVFMLQDGSPELIDSWRFLESRIADLRSLKQMNLKAVSSMLRDGFFALGNVPHIDLIHWLLDVQYFGLGAEKLVLAAQLSRTT
ncbi:ubiquinone biosynthesis protein COQ9 [Paragonimus westermani]|uniref:Ubiquinone biosynthesis protein n=1 Tax=Paragonimus westermani TaxID=34504 RepID=A0A5J4NNM1_9TREM|nr:ubiquinone biosynthesis protein COQ9 [Paragonimus westermani]